MDFTNVSYSDIVQFLREQNVEIPKNKQDAYNLALNIITTKSNLQTSSIPIIDFIIAYNLSTQNINYPTYKSSTVLFASEQQLAPLAKFLGVSDKDRIIRILGYLGVLDNDISI
jgi:hypothetical protein